ncbi:hypothetical protein [Levilactobacillus sp. N40-8-2]|uniref:hypothetical protein n=1 Tax=Levilactobacillus muriae TaxID=3238987 RepID=UPI0038B4071F
MSLSDEIKKSQQEYEKIQKIYLSAQKDLLGDAQEFSELKKQAVEELELIERRQPVVTTAIDVLNWEVFETNVQRFKVTVSELQKQMQDSLNAQESTGKRSGIFGGLVASGLVSGAGMAAPTAAMALASTFGVASTGTAIASLSGAAATNAALALIGGGSMAAGTTFLGLLGPIGWGLGGVITLLTLSNARNKKEKNLKAIQEATVKMKQTVSTTQATRKVIKQVQYLIARSIEKLQSLLDGNASLVISESLKLSELLNTPVTKD